MYLGEVLRLVTEELQTPRGKTLYLQLLDFGRTLRRGEVHTFGVRWWVEKNPDLDDEGHVVVETDYRAEVVGVHINSGAASGHSCAGPYEGYPDDAMAPGDPRDGTVLGLSSQQQRLR